MEAIDLAKTQMEQHIALAIGHFCASLAAIRPLITDEQNTEILILASENIKEIRDRTVKAIGEPKRTFQ